MPSLMRRLTWLNLALLLFCKESHGATPRFSFFGRKPNSTAAAAVAPSDDSSSSWTNFLTMDPSRIMATLVNNCGLVLPKSIQKELMDAMKVCHVDHVEWNPVQKRLVFNNFTVTAPGMDGVDSLRVGRVSVSWESYTSPCLDIEVDDVDVLLEFSNLLLTKNNWGELSAAGFPPAMMSESSETTDSEDYSFVRIGSMDLSGNLRAVIRSRPLDHDVCPPWILDLDSFDEWNDELRRLSKENLAESGRRGCTTNQFYDWAGKYVGDKLRSVLTSTAYDLATQPFAEQDTDTVVRAKGLFAHARRVVKSYALQVTSKGGRELQDSVKLQLDSLGLKERARLGVGLDENATDVEEIDGVKRAAMTAYQLLREVAAEQLERVEGALRAAEEADAGQPAIVLPDNQ